MATLAAIEALLRTIPDPEIPGASIVDLGMIGQVEVSNEEVQVELIPTFAGCAAVPLIRQQIVERLAAAGYKAQVQVAYQKPWHPSRIRPEGWDALKKAGFAIPRHLTDDPETLFSSVTCPRCGSNATSLASPFGPTACRAIFRCHSCGEAFQLFKPPI